MNPSCRRVRLRFPLCSQQPLQQTKRSDLASHMLKSSISVFCLLPVFRAGVASCGSVRVLSVDRAEPLWTCTSPNPCACKSFELALVGAFLSGIGASVFCGWLLGSKTSKICHVKSETHAPKHLLKMLRTFWEAMSQSGLGHGPKRPIQKCGKRPSGGCLRCAPTQIH